ncbi:MAG: hypothetical protein FJX69_02850 [Alphaproteobacteria bacterium]|nr:hypothetical protein [Alphaproteobacteria bacterium]
MKPRPIRAALAASLAASLAAALALAACSSSVPMMGQGQGEGQGAEVAGFGSFPDIAIPSGASFDLDRSLVLGAGREWTGRLVFAARGSVAATYDFFRAEMPRLGWTEVTSLRSATSFVAFQQASRVATIQISGRSLGGSTVEMVMAPRGAGEGAGPGGGSGRGGIEASPNPPPRR